MKPSPVVANPLPRRQIYRLPRAQRVADIMLTARAVFREKGYNDAMIAEIAGSASAHERNSLPFDVLVSPIFRPKTYAR